MLGHAVDTTAGRAASSASYCSGPSRKSSRLRPKGLPVSARMAAASRAISAGPCAVAPSTPRPPASETAATSAGDVAVPMPPRTMGCSIPNSSQIRVRSMSLSLSAGLLQRGCWSATGQTSGSSLTSHRARAAFTTWGFSCAIQCPEVTTSSVR